MANCDVNAVVLHTNKISDHSTVLIESKIFSKPVDKNLYVRRTVGYKKSILIQSLNDFKWENLGLKSLSEKAKHFK